MTASGASTIVDAAAAASTIAIASAWPVSSSHTVMVASVGVTAAVRAGCDTRSRMRRRELVDGQGRVEHEEALGLGGGELEVGGAHAGVEVVALGLEPVVAGARLGEAGLAGRGIVEVEQHGEVGQQALGGPERELAHLGRVEHATGALVGDGRVEVAVLDDDLAALERGAHDGRDVVGAVGGVEQRLGARRDVAAAVQHDLADLLAEVGAAGLAGVHDRAALRDSASRRAAPTASTCPSRRRPRR